MLCGTFQRCLAGWKQPNAVCCFKPTKGNHKDWHEPSVLTNAWSHLNDFMHNGLALQLDCWQVETEKWDAKWDCLDAFSKSKPSLKTIEEISNYLAINYVGGADIDVFGLRGKQAAERDCQKENMLLLHQYLLLYEEMSYAMNAGDIGRIETLFDVWIYLFRAMGKHKYAAHMIKFLTAMHFVYPKGLCTIRYNMLVNPTGKLNAFCGVDWVVELLNLFTKVSRMVLLHYTCLTARTACFWRTGLKLLKRSCSERVSTCQNLP